MIITNCRNIQKDLLKDFSVVDASPKTVLIWGKTLIKSYSIYSDRLSKANGEDSHSLEIIELLKPKIQDFVLHLPYLIEEDVFCGAMRNTAYVLMQEYESVFYREDKGQVEHDLSEEFNAMENIDLSF